MRYIYLLGAFCISLTVYGQQPTRYSLYMLNPYVVNAASAGLSGTLEASGSYRSQWVGLPGSPTSQLLTAAFPIGQISSGVGLMVQNEQIGARTGLTAKLSYNYIANLGPGRLSVGVEGGIVQGTLDGSRLRTPSGDYNQGIVDHRDNILSTATTSGATPSFGLSAYYKTERLNVGLSVGNLTEPKLTLAGQRDIQVALKRYFQAYAGLTLELGDRFKVYPSILAQSDVTQTQIDLSAFFRYNDNIFIGASFRGYSGLTQDAVILFGGLPISTKLTIGYAYDLTISSLKTAQQGSHEITLQYTLGTAFGKGKLPPIIYNPRF